MTTKLHPITVDIQEKIPPPDVRVKELHDLGTPAIIGNLETADYRWVVEPDDGPWTTVLVERKSVDDFIASLPPNGRLNRFIDKTGGLTPPDNQIRALLLEGDQFASWRRGTWNGREISNESLDNLLLSLQSFGVIVLRSEGVEQTAERLHSFWKYTGNPDHSTLLQPVKPQVSTNYIMPDDKEAVRMIMCLPGFGETKAKALLQEHRSVALALMALESADAGSRTALANVPRVGKGMATNAVALLDREVSF